MTEGRDNSAARPDLSTLTVLEVSGGPGGAFAAGMLADFGARVVACEPPPHGSALRRLGPPAVREVWWPIAARNKLSLALDAAHPGAPPVLERLLSGAAVLVRDDAAAPWRAAAARLPRPPLDLHLHPPGADRPALWPWGTAPELAAAASGAMALTGEADGPPAQPEMPLADHSAGLLAAAFALFELRAVSLDGRLPVPLEVGLHEALARMNEWQVVVAAAQGRPELRNGNRFPINANIGNVFRTRDGKLLTVSAATAPVAERLLAMIGGEALRDDPRFRTPAARRENMDAIDALLAEWMARYDAAEALALVRANDVVAGTLYDADDLLADPHVAARENVVRVARGDGGPPLPMPAPLPRIEGVAGGVRWAGPPVGAHSNAVLRAAGFAEAEVAALRRSSVVWA
jgi:crotonobetainyl-CoA:carnitine CoA-transferase CaiB-like acyl-CoA transferase